MLFGLVRLARARGFFMVTALLGLFASWASSAYAQMPPPKVEFLEMASSSIRQWVSYSGRISPVESVVVKPLVGGRIDQVLFNDGELVERGQALFVIDPRPYEAAVKQAEALLETAKAKVRLATQELKRSQELLVGSLISQSIYDESLTAKDVAVAAVLQAESQLLSANLNLEYAHIVAPISGRVGRAELTVGNIVAAGISAPTLTTIVAQSQVYAEFRVDEQSYLDLLQNSPSPAKMPVLLTLANAVAHSHKGYLHAFDNHIDSASGTVRARALFNNEDGSLIPGMYASIEVGSALKQSAYLIPERAIGTDQDRKFVYIIDDQNHVQYRQVDLGQQFQGQRVVHSGLANGDRVAVNGLSRIRPQALVEPVPAVTQKSIAISKF